MNSMATRRVLQSVNHFKWTEGTWLSFRRTRSTLYFS
jgi:hypothetical protein